VPTSPDVYVHRIGRTGRVGRSGRAITFYEPKQKRDIEAIERHTGTPMAPWTEGARVAALSVELKPKRHESKPHDEQRVNGAAPVNGDGRRTRLVVAAGLADGIEPKDLIHAITSAAGIDGEAVRNVRVLQRFAFLDVPADEATRVVAQVDGTAVDGHRLRLEPIAV
jgi:ATP-dependent RNA helicase DeaD